MPQLNKTDEWKNWADGKNLKSRWTLPVFNVIDFTWIVLKPDSNDYMIVPDIEYREWWDNKSDRIKTRYDV